MKKTLLSFMLCTMLLCISTVSFGTDGAKITQEPERVVASDFIHATDTPTVVIVSPVIVSESTGLVSLSSHIENVYVPFNKTLIMLDAITNKMLLQYPAKGSETYKDTGTTRTENYVTLPKQMTASNHVGKLVAISKTNNTGNFI